MLRIMTPVSRRERLSSPALSLVVWFFLFLFPATGWADDAKGCQMARVASMPIELKFNRILAGAAINGKEVFLAVDTGAATTMVFADAAQALDLAVTHNEHLKMYGLGGELVMGETEIGEFSLGQWAVRDWLVPVGGNSPDWKRMAVAGVLGEDFFKRFDVEFDLANHQVNLYDPRHCDDAWLGFWSDKTVAVDFDRVGRHQEVIEIAFDLNGHTFHAQLDSGANVTVLSSTAAERAGVSKDGAGVQPAPPLSGLGRRKVESWVGSFDSFRLGDETIHNVHLRFGDFGRDAKKSETGSRLAEDVLAYDMLLGADFLAAHHLLISHSQGKIYFSYNGGPVFRGG
jgi:hypothetical protein